jgi:hypothetical protein
LTAENSSYVYVDCDNNLQTLTLAPNTCNAVCMLYPPVNPLPTYWSAIVTGGCTGGVYFETGEDVNLTIGATGSTLGTNLQVAMYGATGGTMGTYIPMQYYFLTPVNSLDLTFNVPFGYGVKFDLTWPTGASGASINTQTMLLKVNGGTGFYETRSGTYQPITGGFPAAIAPAVTIDGYEGQFSIDF